MRVWRPMSPKACLRRWYRSQGLPLPSNSLQYVRLIDSRATLRLQIESEERERADSILRREMAEAQAPKSLQRRLQSPPPAEISSFGSV